MVMVENEDYNIALNELLEQIKDVIKDQKETTVGVLDYNKDVKHEIIFRLDDSKPKHRLSWPRD